MEIIGKDVGCGNNISFSQIFEMDATRHCYIAWFEPDDCQFQSILDNLVHRYICVNETLSPVPAPSLSPTDYTRMPTMTAPTNAPNDFFLSVCKSELQKAGYFHTSFCNDGINDTLESENGVYPDGTTQSCRVAKADGSCDPYNFGKDTPNCSYYVNCLKSCNYCTLSPTTSSPTQVPSTPARFTQGEDGSGACTEWCIGAIVGAVLITIFIGVKVWLKKQATVTTINFGM